MRLPRFCPASIRLMPWAHFQAIDNVCENADLATFDPAAQRPQGRAILGGVIHDDKSLHQQER